MPTTMRLPKTLAFPTLGELAKDLQALNDFLAKQKAKMKEAEKQCAHLKK
jgi:hypothetical protein